MILSSFALAHLALRPPFLAAANPASVPHPNPYRYIRFPIWSAILVFIPGTTLFLGSFYGLLALPILGILVARWTLLEERSLLRNFPEYEAFKSEVPHRLLPRVW